MRAEEHHLSAHSELPHQVSQYKCRGDIEACDKPENLKQQLTGNTASWRKLADSAGAGVQADSGRYELAQIPVPARTAFSPGLFTAFFTNKADNTVTFSYILNVYNERAPRNYRDARGFVINDYQLYLEDRWIEELKKKYPVVVDETVLRGLK